MICKIVIRSQKFGKIVRSKQRGRKLWFYVHLKYMSFFKNITLNLRNIIE